MRVFAARVVNGFGVASGNLAPVMSLIEERMGLKGLVPGTLNVEIPEDYIVISDALIHPEEYPLNRICGTSETIKLQRCVVQRRKAIIMRPDTHETVGWGHGTKHLELMAVVRFRDVLGLANGSRIEVEVEGDDAWWAAAI